MNGTFLGHPQLCGECVVSSTLHLAQAFNVSLCSAISDKLMFSLLQNSILCQQMSVLNKEKREVHSVMGMQTHFLSRLNFYQGIRIVLSSSRLTNLAFVCKSTKQITPPLDP